MMKNVIGIDFGTSTTVVRTKAYQDQPEDNSLETRSLIFSQDGAVTVPTLIREDQGNRSYGHKASMGHGTLYENFKLGLLITTDTDSRDRAVELTEDFFNYLHRVYLEQEKYVFERNDLETETRVSYPPQWSREQQEMILNAAKKAGFPNVVGMDEATASVRCIFKAKQEELVQKGLLKRDIPLNVLVIDMGAGTTDLAFVKATLGDTMTTEVLGTWPPEDSMLIFGGSKLDARCKEILKEWLNGSKLPQCENLIKNQSYQIKRWKEQTLSPTLSANQTVTDCAALSYQMDILCNALEMETPVFPEMTRSSFERDFSEQWNAFKRVIESAPAELRKGTQLIILTGGNSSWYCIDKILRGNDAQGNKIFPSLEDILTIELPNETVARGLVLETAKIATTMDQESQQPADLAQTFLGIVKRIAAVYEENKKNHAYIHVVRRPRGKGSLRDYFLRIDGSTPHRIKNDDDYTLTVSPGSHLLETCNATFFNRDPNWDNNIFPDLEFRFRPGSTLLLDFTMDEADYSWEDRGTDD